MLKALLFSDGLCAVHPSTKGRTLQCVGLLLSAALVLSACTFTDPTESSSSGTAGLPVAELEEFAQRALEQSAPSVVLQVRHGDQQTVRAYGVKDLDSKEAAEATDRLWITGAGTPMVAVSVLKLVEEGKVALDAPITDYLPEFVSLFPAWQGTTVRELLGSRTGLPDYFPRLAASMPAEQLQTTALSYEQRLRIAAGTGLPRPPAVDRALWSATDWEVLAWMLERIHGRPLAEVLATDIFGPAGMTSTLVASPGQPREPMLHGYALSAGTRLDFTRVDVFAGSGDAGIISTVEDVSTFFRALAAGVFLGDEMKSEMLNGSQYQLGGLRTKDDICPGRQHVIFAGGGGPWSIVSVSSLDGQQQAAAAMALPPMDLDTGEVPLLVEQIEHVVGSTAAAMCSQAPAT